MQDNAPKNILERVRIILEMIKFSHTIFALPFAVTAAVVAADGMPPPRTLLWILAAMIGARSAAMAFNRLVDARMDAKNPRTSDRALPLGTVGKAEVVLFILGSSAIFVFAAYMLNRLTLILSPVALLIILGYSLTKRFTSLSHLVLGLALAIAPAGAWIAVTGDLSPVACVLSLGVLTWTAGFDVIYSCQDIEHDRCEGLFSIPARFGMKMALSISSFLHVLTIVSLVLFTALVNLGVVAYAGVGLVAVALVYEHRLVKPDDLSRVNMAFFTVNGFVSIAFMLFVVVDVMLA